MGEVRVTAYRPLPDDSPCYALVGLIAAEQSRIEYMLDSIIWDLAGVHNDKIACLTGQLSGLPARYNTIANLLRLADLHSKFVDRLNKQLSDSHALVEARNRAIHDPWFEESQTGGSYQFTVPGRKLTTFGNRPVTPDDLAKTLARFRDFYQRVMDLRGDVWALTRA